MKDTLKMQGVTRPVVGIKKLIDYYNENYTRKKEYICKDLNPVKLLNGDEYNNFKDNAGLIRPQEIRYYPLFKAPKIKNNRLTFISYILKTDVAEYKGIMKQSVRNGRKENYYRDNSVSITINGDEIVLGTYDMSINVNSCSLTLYINSPELPKLEYPKNKMDMYRAISFIETISFSLRDSNLDELLGGILYSLSMPNNIDELSLMLDILTFVDFFDFRKNAHFINSDKDNYYTILDAIKKGKTIYKNLDTPLVNWKINKEEKAIYLGNVIATETGLEIDPE